MFSFWWYFLFNYMNPVFPSHLAHKMTIIYLWIPIIFFLIVSCCSDFSHGVPSKTSLILYHNAFPFSQKLKEENVDCHLPSVFCSWDRAAPLPVDSVSWWRRCGRTPAPSPTDHPPRPRRRTRTDGATSRTSPSQPVGYREKMDYSKFLKASSPFCGTTDTPNLD